MKTTRSAFLLGLCLALLPSAAVAGAAAPAARLRHFVTRKADRLYEGAREFRFIGANMPGLVLPYDWTLSLPERMHLPTAWEQEDALETLDQMNARVVRTWNLPIRAPDEPAKPWHYVLGPGKFNESAFRVLDSLLALANRYGVRVILDLTAESGDYLGGIGTYAAHRGRKRAEFYTDPQLKTDYLATVRHVLTRTNTITGVPYREDKAVLAWQFGNEMHGAPDAWVSEMAAAIKRLDPNHLVAETRHRPGDPLLIDPNVDLLTRHLYPNYRGAENGWPAAIRKELAGVRGKRPLFIGEFGPYIDGRMFTHANAVDTLRAFLDFVHSDPAIAGALIWSMYFHHEAGGFYWHQIMTYPAVWSYHWPGFQSADAQREIGLLHALREAAFRLEGKPAPPLPVPHPPTLLSIGDIPQLSWRGSAGARGYDIERAPAAAGPWTRIAAAVSDADVAYRPLYSDASVRAGQTWFYRVSARNDSGASAPSNVVGPVKVRRVCVVDELRDFGRVHLRSQGLDLTNDYNALYAEYLFRARGDAGAWIRYRVLEPIDFVRVTAFFPGPIADLTLHASAEGDRFAALAARRTERRLPTPPRGATKGQSRTMMVYECDVPPGNHHLKLDWTGPAELDRVEIFHR